MLKMILTRVLSELLPADSTSEKTARVEPALATARSGGTPVADPMEALPSNVPVARIVM